MKRERKACESKGLQENSMAGKEKGQYGLSLRIWKITTPMTFKNTFSYPNQLVLSKVRQAAFALSEEVMCQLF